MPPVKPLRVLLIVEKANPEGVSVPLEGWSHSRAIAEMTDALAVTQIRHRDAFLQAGLVEGTDFEAIDSERVARPLWKLSSVLRGGKGRGWTTVTAFSALAYYEFERLLWRRFGSRIRAGDFDVVHRVTPLSPTTPSLLARKCRRAGVPFVLGPINGGVPWPQGFDAARREEREWLSYVRGVHKLLPGYRATRRNAAAIMIGSSDTFAQMPARYHDKCVYVPENAIDPRRFTRTRDRSATLPLRIAFVGRLVPYKGVDMLLEAAADLARRGQVTIDIIGDGPQRAAIETQIARDGLEQSVRMLGWVPHTELQDHLIECDLFGFPSIREFGGAVVLEAMATGLVPLVVEYGGPAELVTPRTGFAIEIGSREQIVAGFRDALERIVDDPGQLDGLSRRAQTRARNQFSWPAKAGQVLEVYRWVTGRRADKPDFGMPLPDVDEATSDAGGPVAACTDRP